MENVMELFVLGYIMVPRWSPPLQIKEKIIDLVLREVASPFPRLRRVYVCTATPELAHVESSTEPSEEASAWSRAAASGAQDGL